MRSSTATPSASDRDVPPASVKMTDAAPDKDRVFLSWSPDEGVVRPCSIVLPTLRTRLTDQLGSE